jgi:hypothetical protein
MFALTPKDDFELERLNSPESMTTDPAAAVMLTLEIRKPIWRNQR